MEEIKPTVKMPQMTQVPMNLVYGAFVVAGIGIVLGIVGLVVGYQGYAAKQKAEEEAQNIRTVTPTPTQSPFVTVTESPTPTLTVTGSASPTVTPTITVNTATISVYMFSNTKFNQPGNTDYTQAVNRQTTRTDVATFGVEEIIKGPTAAEQSQGLKASFGADKFIWFTETSSNCNGKDFSIAIDSAKKATVKFCRNTALSGDMSGFVIEQQIGKTLKQFPTIIKVVILNKSGSCFNDMKGSTPAQDCE